MNSMTWSDIVNMAKNSDAEGLEFETIYKDKAYQISIDNTGSIDSVRTCNPDGPAYWHDLDALTESEEDMLVMAGKLKFHYIGKMYE